MITARVTAAAFCLSSIGTVIQEAAGRDSSDRFGLQDMAMPSLTAHLATTARPGRTRDAATIALLASTAGDMSGTLQFKLGWFAAAHLSYVAAFSKGKHRRWWIAGAAIIAAGVWASAKAAGLRPACAVYACLVAAMAIAASSYSKLAGASALMFALSDFLIGFGMWRAKRQTAWGRAVIIATYLIAQAGLTAAIIREEGKA